MNDEYCRIYNELIKDQCSNIVIDYDLQNKRYIYHPFSHMKSDTALNDLYNLLVDNIVFYAYSEEEIVSKNKIGLLDDLRVAAKYAFSERLPQRINPNSDGTLGEVLLDLLIQVFEPMSQKLIARAKFTEVEKRKYEITGYDALYFSMKDQQVTLWLGQAKAGTEQYCKSGIKEDLNTKFYHEYFANAAFYVADRSDSPELTNLLSAINKVCFEAQKNHWDMNIKIKELYKVLKNNNVKIKIPCLLAYTSDIYKNAELEKQINFMVTKMQKYFDETDFKINLDLPCEIRFYIFPIKDVSYVRKMFINLKKETV